MPYFVIRTKKSAYIWIQNYRLLWRTNYPGTLSNNRDNNPVQKYATIFSIFQKGYFKLNKKCI